MPPIDQRSVGNLLLRALSPADFALLAPALERVTLPVGATMFHPNTPITHNYFIESGVGSLVTEQENGEQVEVGLYGLDGMSGTAVLLGAEQSPHRSFIQVGDAQAIRIPADALRAACGRSATLSASLLRFVQTLMVQASYTAGSNAHYALPERLARWLLMCHDRVEGDRIALTHEFMATMLAVRRSGVTVTLHTLEGTGAIRSTRGVVQVLDRERLREIAGEGYGAPEREYARLIAPFGKG